jgi:hypothetical protein
LTYEKQVCVLVCTCKAYEDITILFDHFYKQFSHDKFQLTYVTDGFSSKIQNQLSGRKLITDNTSWKQRLIYALQAIESQYVILLLEDYFISKSVSETQLDMALTAFVESNLQYLRLYHKPKPRPCSDVFSPINRDPYQVNMQPSIWDKSFLVNSLHATPGETAWDFEIHLSNLGMEGKLSADTCKVFTHQPIVIKNAILKGKWDPNVLRWTKRMIGKDFSTSREILTIRDQIWLKTRVLGSYLTPRIFRKPIKWLLRKVGFAFTTNF